MILPRESFVHRGLDLDWVEDAIQNHEHVQNSWLRWKSEFFYQQQLKKDGFSTLVRMQNRARLEAAFDDLVRILRAEQSRETVGV